jgi:hypothetical protein
MDAICDLLTRAPLHGIHKCSPSLRCGAIDVSEFQPAAERACCTGAPRPYATYDEPQSRGEEADDVRRRHERYGLALVQLELKTSVAQIRDPGLRSAENRGDLRLHALRGQLRATTVVRCGSRRISRSATIPSSGRVLGDWLGQEPPRRPTEVLTNLLDR